MLSFLGIHKTVELTQNLMEVIMYACKLCDHQLCVSNFGRMFGTVIQLLGILSFQLQSAQGD